MKNDINLYSIKLSNFTLLEFAISNWQHFLKLAIETVPFDFPGEKTAKVA